MDLFNILAVLGAFVLGSSTIIAIRSLIGVTRTTKAKSEAESLLESAEQQKRRLLLDAKEEIIQLRSSAEGEIKARRTELQKVSQRLANREENSDKRAVNLDRRERKLVSTEDALETSRLELEELRASELTQLEHISSLSHEEAKNILLTRAEGDISRELQIRYRDAEKTAKEDAESKARKIVSESIHRLASDVVSEVSVSTVPLPREDLKGRLIGREGRNIKAISKATGVDLIVDDTPEAVTLSCFDPVRREVARVAVNKLLEDGRIHPARIEDMVKKAQKEVSEDIWKSGEDAVFEAGVRGLHPEIVKLLGRLKYRYSYGENVLMHSLEVGHLAGMIASEVGADVNVCKVGGLLHDLGKALSHEIEGPHAEIGADVAAKFDVSSPVRVCVAEHHNDDMSSVEAFIVSASDAISAARPGARRDTVEAYTKRLEALEDVAGSFDGVEKCFAIQAGREVRIMVEPDNVDDVAASSMARDIVKKIENTLVYPGQIKVIVIRESRSVEYAR
ncbi:MAG: ribonuclease Y [Chloroflexota bacterium]|nr:ribonuclease Y [Chloroflexota bacterium]